MNSNKYSQLHLSSAQKSLWHLYQFSPESYAFNIGCNFKYPYPVTDKQITAAIEKIYKRHKILTSTFHFFNSDIYQRANEQIISHYKHIDASKWISTDIQENIYKLLISPFNLEEGPLIRFFYITGLVENGSVFFITAHQIVADRLALAVISNEFLILLQNPDNLLSELKFTYSKYVDIQNRYLKSEESERNLEYWKKQIDVDSVNLDLPTDYNRPAIRILHGKSLEFILKREISEKIIRVAKEADVTPAEVILTIYILLLSKLSSQNIISVGINTDDRDHYGIDKYIVGPFTNYIPLFIECDKDQTILSLVNKIHKQKIRSYENSKYPFGMIVEKVPINNDHSRSPFFQTTFIWNSKINSDTHLDEFIKIPQEEGQFDLSLSVDDYGDYFSAQLKYASSLFTESRIIYFIERFDIIMNYLLDNLHKTIDDIQLISDNEKMKIIYEWNNTYKKLPENYTIQKLFEDNVDLAPDAIAVMAGNDIISYAELESKSNQLANYLRKYAVKNNTLVGIYIDRSAEMIVGLMGILKSGAAYVPIDPSYPTDRINYIINDSSATVIITKNKFLEELSFFNGNCICLDNLSNELNECSDIRPERINKPDDLAYVIYTSGSTGQPKGVEIRHEGAVNFLLHVSETPGIKSNDVFTAIATICFDMSVLDIFGSLSAGACIALIEKEVSADAEKLAEALDKYRVTISQATPTTWDMLISTGWKGRGDLKILCGGEMLKRDLAMKLLACSGELWNMYGPTETTVYSACKRITEDEPEISAGKPIANTSIYILDEKMRPVPVGLVGDLYIGGKGVAGGYHNKPDLTKAKFIPDPYSRSGKDIMYSTGDRAKYLPDGEIVIIGRSDFQVKIRGFRIELEEVESVIKSHPAVGNAVVTAVDNYSGQKILAVYLVSSDSKLSSTDLQNLCAKKLPDYMIPSAYIFIDKIPLTPNGKVDIKALPPITQDYYKRQISFVPPTGETEYKIANIWKRVLLLDRVGVNNSFFDLGGTSISASLLAVELRRQFRQDISVVRIFQYPTIKALAEFIDQTIQEKPLLQNINERIKKQHKQTTQNKGIAVIGMSGRFPEADSIDALWENLLSGKESVTQFSRDELEENDETLINDPSYIPAKGILTDIDKFDAPFFEINPIEAQVMDPQQRLMMETAWTSLENAGYSPEHYDGLIGVYAGMGNNNYYINNIHNHPDILNRVGAVTVELGMEKDHIAPRISFKMNLKGPSLSIHTACSTALVAVDSAVHALLSYQCDIAMAGSISLTIPQKNGKLYQEGGIFTKDGHCRPFDADATGTMFGEAVAMVVLKRLEDALSDNDTIHAVIRGSAVNHDGSQKASYLAPNVESQAEVIAMAQARADIHPDTIGFVEAHGTATPIGDPIEVEGLTKAFRLKTDKKQYCAIGSIKGNLGHTVTTAGLSGMIKTVMALKHRVIPPSINYKNPNPHIDFKNSPFFVNTEIMKWPDNMYPARAGVSSFGYCGTNAHVVLEEYNDSFASNESRSRQLLILSAKTESSLKRMTNNFINFLKGNTDINLADAVYTLQKGRTYFNHRKFVVCSDVEDAITQLGKPDPNRSGDRLFENSKPRIVFLFPGQGSQYINMGKTLYRDESLFREIVDNCSLILKSYIGLDIRELLYPLEGDEKSALLSLKETKYTQPAIFIIEYALSKLWMSWDIIPDAMIGHSIGEFVCATLSGVFSLEDALMLVAARGALMQDLPRGTMLSVLCDADSIEKILPEDLSLAAVNGPKLCVVSGPTERVALFEQKLNKEGIITRELHSSHAFHSLMMDPVVEPFKDIVCSIKLSEAELPFISTVTGKRISNSEATDPSYWSNHLRATVKFSNAISEILDDTATVLLEVGPRSTSATLARQQIKDFSRHTAIASLSDNDSNEMEWVALLKAIGMLWQWGVNINWDIFYKDEKRKRIPLPTYSFEKIRYWIDPPKKQKSFSEDKTSSGLKDKENQEIENETSCSENIDVRNILQSQICRIVEEISGIKITDSVLNTSFVELGFDSLILTQIARNLTKEFKVQISFRQLMEKIASINILTDFIDSIIIEDSFINLPLKTEVSFDKDSNAADCEKVNCKPEDLDLSKVMETSDHGKQVRIIGKLVDLLKQNGVKTEKINEIILESKSDVSNNLTETLKAEIKIMDSRKPPVPGARLGKDENGKPAWYVPDPENNSKYIKLE